MVMIYCISAHIDICLKWSDIMNVQDHIHVSGQIYRYIISALQALFTFIYLPCPNISALFTFIYLPCPIISALLTKIKMEDSLCQPNEQNIKVQWLIMFKTIYFSGYWSFTLSPWSIFAQRFSPKWQKFRQVWRQYRLENHQNPLGSGILSCSKFILRL